MIVRLSEFYICIFRQITLFCSPLTFRRWFFVPSILYHIFMLVLNLFKLSWKIGYFWTNNRQKIYNFLFLMDLLCRRFLSFVTYPLSLFNVIIKICFWIWNCKSFIFWILPDETMMNFCPFSLFVGIL